MNVKQSRWDEYVAIAACFLALILLSLMCCKPADACRFGTCRSCVTRKVVKQVVPQANNTDVFVVQNNYPQPLIAQGASQYTAGYQAAVLPFFDPNAFSASNMELLKQMQGNTAASHTLATSFAERITTLQAPAFQKIATGQAASMVLQAAGFDPAYNDTSSAVVVTRNKQGQVQVLPLSAAQVQQINQRVETELENPVGTVPMTGALSTHCAKCHGVQLAEPKGGFYIGDDPGVVAGMRNNFFDITNLVSSGKMPPEASLTTEQKQAVLNEIQQLILKHGE